MASDEATEKYDGGPAFPVTWEEEDGQALTSPGISVRQYYAAHAMMGILAHTPIGTDATDVAKHALRFADALLKEE